MVINHYKLQTIKPLWGFRININPGFKVFMCLNRLRIRVLGYWVLLLTFLNNVKLWMSNIHHHGYYGNGDVSLATLFPWWLSFRSLENVEQFLLNFGIILEQFWHSSGLVLQIVFWLFCNPFGMCSDWCLHGFFMSL